MPAPPFMLADDARAGHCILGIDPGVTGGIAFLFGDGTIAALDVPTVAGELDADALAHTIRTYSPHLAAIERASSRPGEGQARVFNYGTTYGMLRGVVATLGITYHLVTAGAWKRHFRLDSDKEKARALAIRLWPGCGFFSRKKDHGRAEAALIARYAQEQLVRNTESKNQVRAVSLFGGHPA